MIPKSIECKLKEDKYDKHYQNMDFMRGVAALTVVLTHFSHRLDISNFAKHGYLAVDFFFVLSGFVMCSAYSAPLKERVLGIKHFYALRLVRIFPLALLGTSIAALLEIIRPGMEEFDTHIVYVIIAYLFGIMILPTTMNKTLEQTAFPLNLPIWSLFFELIANAFFPFILTNYIKKQIIFLLIVFGALAIAIGVLYYGTANQGYYTNDLWFGFARICYSFSIGMIVYHYRWKAPPVNFFVPSLIFILFAFNPYNTEYDAYIDIISVIFIMPLLVFLSIRAGNGSYWKNVSKWAGIISFPVYALHYPFSRILSVIEKNWPMNLLLKSLLMAAFLLFVLVFSYLAYRFFDLPVRSYLAKKLR